MHTHETAFERIKHTQKNSHTKTPTHQLTLTHTHTHTRTHAHRREMGIHYCMCTLQSILHTVQRLIYSRGAVVIVRQLAQLVQNSLHGVQPNCVRCTTASQGTCRIGRARPPASRKGTRTLRHSSPGARAHTEPNEREPPMHDNFRGTC